MPRDLGRKIHLKSQPQEGQEAGTKTKLGVPTWPVTQSGMWDDTFHVEYFVFLFFGGGGNWRVIISINPDWGIFSQSNALLTAAALAAPKSQLLDKQSA